VGLTYIHTCQPTSTRRARRSRSLNYKQNVALTSVWLG